MRQFSKAAQSFILGVILCSSLLLALLLRSASPPEGGTERLVLLFLALAAAMADVYHIHLYYRIEITMSTASNFAAILIFGPALACGIGFLGSALSDIYLRKPWYKVLFNASNTVLSVATSGLVYILFNDTSPHPLGSLQNALALGAAGLTYLAVNAFLVCTVVGLVERHNPWDVYRANLRGTTFQLITLIPLGTLIAAIYHQTPWGLALILFPIILAHYSFESYQKLRTESKRTVELLAEAVDQRDDFTGQHSQKVAHYAEMIGRKMGLDLMDLEELVSAALIHDLGKVGADYRILSKPAKLTEEERRKIEEHPQLGAEIVGQLSLYREVKGLVAYHQEHYDGTGYPAGLKGKEIPLGARILAVADAFDAMTSDRPYRPALPYEKAVAELDKCKGSQFDPEVVEAFLAALEEERRAATSLTLRDALAGQQGD